MVFNSLARLFQKVFLSRILSNNLGFQVLSPGEITNKGYFQYAKFRGGGGANKGYYGRCANCESTCSCGNCTTYIVLSGRH